MCVKWLEADGKNAASLTADVEMYRQVVAVYSEAGVMDESGREIGDVGWDEKLDITGDWLRRHADFAVASRMARVRSPHPRV